MPLTSFDSLVVSVLLLVVSLSFLAMNISVKEMFSPAYFDIFKFFLKVPRSFLARQNVKLSLISLFVGFIC